jgi:hypothetical protein
MPDPDGQLANWFAYLCAMHNDAATLSLDTAAALDQFAKQLLSVLLPDPPHQDQYAQMITLHTDLLVSSGDIAASKTPLDLLNTLAPTLSAYVLGVFQFVACDAVSSPPVFQAKLAAQVYSTDCIRATLVQHLQADLCPAWLPAAKQLKLQAQLQDPSVTVQQCVTLVSTL